MLYEAGRCGSAGQASKPRPDPGVHCTHQAHTYVDLPSCLTGYLYSNYTELAPYTPESEALTEAQCLDRSCGEEAVPEPCDTTDPAGASGCCCKDSTGAIITLSASELYTTVKVTYASVGMGSFELSYISM